MRTPAGHVDRVVVCRTKTIGAAALAVLLVLLALSAPAGALGLGPAPDLAAAKRVLTTDRAGAAAIVAEAEATAGITRATSTTARADALRREAQTAQRARAFTRATALYSRARALYLEAGATLRARACLTATQDIFLVASTYSATRGTMLDALAEMYPGVPAEQRAAWLDLPSTERMRWDGVVHYFYDLPTNLAYRDVALFQTQPAMVSAYEEIYQKLASYEAGAAAASPWQPYAEPRAYDFTQTLAVPRDRLPASGDLRVWFPLPIEVGPQDAVRISEIAPATYLRYPQSTTQDIGLLFMPVPLEDLAGDLEVSFRVRFEHAAQYFKVDPALVGRYDTGGALYREYTASHANTKITPSIRRTARHVVGGETNPYLAAQRLYQYVIDHVLYSHMPHFAMYPRGEAESVYVHEHKYGDCGAQSMYFSALCRSVGIPARCTGGFQIFQGTPAGHFWAEFYLPNYGWVPVDPTAATIADYIPELPAAEVQAFRAFYFGNQDDLRLVVQKDTDLPLIPRADGRILLPLAVQMPAALCDTMDEIPGLLLMDYWTFE
jgi:transglutaminase-like putative cysteine protease